MKLSVLTISLAFVFLFVTSCNKEDVSSSYHQGITQLVEESSSISFREEDRCLTPYFEMFSSQLKNYRKNDPATYFPSEFFVEFRTKLEIENEKMQQIGFEQYVDDLVNNGMIALGTKELLVHIRESVNVEEEIIIEDLKNDLITNHNPEFVSIADPFYCYVYNIALEIYNNYYGYYGTSVELRGDCEFKEFVKHVIETAMQGAAIGTAVGSILQDEDGFFVINILGATISVGGAIIGGAIGAIVGIFTFNDDLCQDCHPVATVVISSDDDCDLTRTLRAVGAGTDALAFEWRITQGGTTATLTTVQPLLTVTQIVNEEPIGVSVATLCIPDGETNTSNAELTPFTPTMELDLSTDASSMLGQAGEIEITVINGGIGGIGQSSVTSSVGLSTTFFWQNTNEGSGHIEHAVSIIPSNLGSVIQNINNNAVKVQWNEPGSGYFRITSTNICSGLSTYRSIPVEIN